MAFFDPGEMAELERIAKRRRAYETYRAMASAETARDVSSLVNAYPTMRPGTALALGKSKVAPNTPVAQAAVKAESKRGWGWNSVGDIVKGVWNGDPKRVGEGFSEVADAVDDVVFGGGVKEAGKGLGSLGPIKGISRGMDAGLSSIGQTFQGAMRESVADGDIQGAEWLLGLPHLKKGLQQTDLAAGHREIQRQGGYAGLVTGDTDVDYGKGFFVGGQVKKDAVQQRRTAAPLVGGKAVTVGRYTASQISEPGTRAFSTLSGLIDGSIALGADPTTLVGGPVRRSIEANRVLPTTGAKREVEALPGAQVAQKERVASIVTSREEGLLTADEATEALREAGGLDGTARKTVLPERTAEWLDSKQGRRVREYLAAETSYARMRRLTGGKVDSDTLVRLTDATTDEQVLGILGPKLGVEVRERFGVSREALRAAQGVERYPVGGPKSRLASQMPGTHMDLVNPDVAVETTERFLTNVNLSKVDGLGPERVDYWVERMARQTDRNGRFAVTREMVGEVRDSVLGAERLTTGQREALTRMYDNYDGELRRYAINELGENMAIPGAVIDGVGKPVATPHLYNEYINTSAPLPDARDLRRATSEYVQLVDAVGARGVYDGMNAVADFMTQKAFKVLVLARGAWTVRVVGEEQIRLASSGMTSMFAHPFSHIALATGRKGGKDITGGDISLSDEMQEVLNRGSAGHIKDPRKVRTKHRVVVDRSDPKAPAALLDEIGKLSSDPVMRRVLNGLEPGDLHPNTNLTGLDAVKDWFFNGTGRRFRQEMADADKGGDRAFLLQKMDPEGGINSSDAYIDSLLERAKTTAGGDHRLLEAMATGRIGGEELSFLNQGQRLVNRKALAQVKALIDEGVGPQKIAGDLLVHARTDSGTELLRMYDAATEVMFNTLMSRPTNFLSRSPAFQQFYWKRNAEMIGRMTPEAQEQAIRVAEETGISSKLVKQMRRDAKSSSGDLTIAQADLVAKGYGLEATKKLLYDLSDRSQFFDITRAIFPFGEAWKEVATTWARIGLTENPMVARRSQQVITGLRSADTDGDGEGFFYTDPANGEESFNYPFSGWINEKILGVPVPLKGSAQGLNIFSTSVLPGVGPVVQIPAGRLLPMRPEYEGIRKALLPFGERDLSGGLLESFLPAWFNKARTALDADAPKQERIWSNTVMDTARYLVSTGEYSMNSPDEMERTLEAAQKKARGLYAIRALAQFFVPSPPSPQFIAQDKDGKAVMAIKMVEDFYEMQEEDYTTATVRFIEKYGENAFLTTVAKTEGGGRPSKAMWRFLQENPQVGRKYGDVFGYFMGNDPEFSQEAYNYLLETGIRKPISPKEALELANQRLGQMVYQQAQTKVRQDPKTGKPSPTKSQRVWLAQVRDAISAEYPGYNSTPGNLRDQKLLIDELLRAGKDPVLAETDAGKGLALYTVERERAVEIARERGFTTFTSSKGTADVRAALRKIADDIGQKHPDFIEMFDRTFNREMVNDDEPVEATS